MAVLVLVVLVVTAVVSAVQPPSRGPSGYSCGEEGLVGHIIQGPHCYATLGWKGQVDGARTTVTVRSASPGDGCISNEEWLVSSKAAGLEVEAGYWSCKGQPESWFWADARPGKVPTVHLGRPVPPRDLGLPATVDIHRAGPGAFAIAIRVQGQAVLTGTSTGTGLVPDGVEVGTELSGTGGADLPATRFSDSQWQRSPDPTWHDRSGDEGIMVLLPPRGPVSYRWPGPKTGPTTWASLLVTCIAEPC